MIIAAWRKLRKGKTKRPEVIAIEKNFEQEVYRMQQILANTRPGEVEDESKRFTPPKHTPHYVYEHGKLREIYSPTIREQWVHHIVIQVLAPIITKYSYKFSCGSMPGRGSVYGKRELERIIRKKGFRNFAKLDIRHFFNSVRIDIVIEKLRELIEDSWFLYLVRRIFLWFPKGMPLGFYPSQWLANFVLWQVDQKILQQEPKGYIRYMDDFVIVDDSKRKLHRIVVMMKQELGKLRLRLKSNYTVSKFIYRKKDGSVIGKYIDFMGFVFTRKNTILRRKIMIRATRFARKLHKQTVIAPKQAMSMLSRAGWFKHTDTWIVWDQFMRPMISIKALKKIVSIYSRRESHENKMDPRAHTLLPGAV